jgi:hypothetical protein
MPATTGRGCSDCTSINYATAVFERSDKPDDLDLACALAQFSPPSSPDGLAVGAVNAIEGNQWLVTLMAYGDNHPSRSIEAPEVPENHGPHAPGSECRSATVDRRSQRINAPPWLSSVDQG